MKAPALRVVKARIQQLASKQYSEMCEEHNKAYEQRRLEGNEYATRIALLLKIEFDKKPAKYVKYDDNGLRHTAEWQAVEKAVKAKNPPPASQGQQMVRIGIASLDLSIQVPSSKEAEWNKFALATDDAFMEDDAQAILAALAMLDKG